MSVAKSLVQPTLCRLDQPSLLLPPIHSLMGFPGGAVVKNSPANTGDPRDVGSIPGLGRFPGVGNGKALQYSCLENSMEREAGGLQSMGLQRVRYD